MQIFVLQKAQYDAAGKLSVRSSSTVYFPIIKSQHPVLEGENKINKVIILDTQKIKINKPNAGKSGQGVVHVSQNSVQK